MDLVEQNRKLRALVDMLIAAGRDVVENWESGDLAGAVGELGVVARQAQAELDAMAVTDDGRR